jgi:hypothetical protein
VSPRLLLLVATLVAAAACDPNPSASPATGEPAAAPQFILGCLSIEAAECAFVAQKALVLIPAGRPDPFAIEIELFGCGGPAPCAKTLAARQGQLTIEIADGGEPIQVGLAGTPEAPQFQVAAPAWSGLIQPTSKRAGGPGPFPFEVGHCGLTWQVDFDGSFWVPVGQLDGDAAVVINQERGQIRLLAPNLAEYRNANRFIAQLARFPGPKHVFLCR